MRNDEMIARVVADELGDRGWLRFVATANLPQRPNGSAIVWATSDDLGVADLGSDFRPRTPLYALVSPTSERSTASTGGGCGNLSPISDLLRATALYSTYVGSSLTKPMSYSRF